jgi:hypothetical protein
MVRNNAFTYFLCILMMMRFGHKDHNVIGTDFEDTLQNLINGGLHLSTNQLPMPPVPADNHHVSNAAKPEPSTDTEQPSSFSSMNEVD